MEYVGTAEEYKNGLRSVHSRARIRILKERGPLYGLKIFEIFLFWPNFNSFEASWWVNHESVIGFSDLSYAIDLKGVPSIYKTVSSLRKAVIVKYICDIAMKGCHQLKSIAHVKLLLMTKKSNIFPMIIGNLNFNNFFIQF